MPDFVTPAHNFKVTNVFFVIFGAGAAKLFQELQDGMLRNSRHSACRIDADFLNERRSQALDAGSQNPHAMAPLDAWYRITKKAAWKNISGVRQTFSTADAVGMCTVFNIKGNAYRLITWINYETKTVFIKHVLTHADYDKEDWKNDCRNS